MRLPERVDVVLDSVGAATWEHSMKAVRPGGTIVVAGMTSGNYPRLDLGRLFMANLRVLGTTMGTREELERLVSFCVERGIRLRRSTRCCPSPRHAAASRRCSQASCSERSCSAREQWTSACPDPVLRKVVGLRSSGDAGE